MTLSDIASIGEFVSGIAVLASLIYLTLQIRQTDRNQRALINQGAMARDTDMVNMLSRPEFVAPWVRVLAGEKDFTAEEYWHLGITLRGLLGSLQDTVLQRKAGLIDQVTLDYVQRGVQYVLAQPVMAAIWKDGKPAYPDETIAMVDGLIARTPLAPPMDLPAMLKAALAQGAQS